MLTAIIVEDMPQAIKLLRADLAEHCPDVKIIGIAESIVQGAKLLNQKQPDILFLDILLGDGTGFDLLEIFPDIAAQVIFVTASDEFAVRAFRFAAVDYLLKPVEPELLKTAVQRAKEQLSLINKESLDVLKETIRHPNSLPKRLSLHTQDKIIVVEIEQIIRCESEDNNTWFFLESGQKIFVTRTLKQFDKLLEKHLFMRTHQSHLVNLKHIQEFVKREGGYLRMKNGDHVSVSVRKRQDLMRWFEEKG